MSYQVLARKWRPRGFEQMVGQDHVVRALSNALDHDRVHHAFLFTGTRGVGKTSVARIFAKSLNCEQGISSRPCGDCGACRDIDAGRFVDLIEVDAASRTGVDDTRDLLDNVQYAPAHGRFKVYLIDEVHMFSKSSFNALLKTLEEPPPHVKFLLATTDPQKLPVTILSRCLQFNLRSLSPGLIAEHLDVIVKQEGVECESGALGQIARAADGSVRDALSLLDQAISFGGGQLAASEVADMLGSIDQHHVMSLMTALSARDGRAVLGTVAELSALSADYERVLADLVTMLQRVALVQVAPEAVDDFVADPADLRRLADSLSPEDVQLFYQIGLIGRRDLPLSPERRGGFEMILLRMLAFRPDDGRGASEPVAGPGSVVANTRPGSADRSVATASTPSAVTPMAANEPGEAGPTR
jgi:DNA polymerase-3 subunit gamma/tau